MDAIVIIVFRCFCIAFIKKGILLLNRERRTPMAQNKKQETIDPAHLKPEDKLKFEIAEELGLGDKVINGGWKSLNTLLRSNISIIFWFA